MILSIIPTLTEQLQTLKYLYDTIDSKSTKSLLPLDILFFIHDRRFYTLLRHIFEEIVELRGETLPSDLDDAHLIQQLMKQDYGLDFCYKSFSEKNIYLRLHLLNVTMGDLFIERLQHRKKLKSSLSLVQKTPEKINLNLTNSFLLTKTNEHIQSCVDVLAKMCSNIKDTSEEMSENQEKNKLFHDDLIDMIMKLHKEYSLRYKVIQKRFDITIQSFLWTKHLKTPLNVYEILQPFVESKNEIKCPYITLLDIIVQGPKAWDNYGQLSQKKIEPCFLRSLKIGQVEFRGGIPEDYSNDHVRQEVQISNRRMRNSHFNRRK